MTKEEKDLLLRDLCSRLPYGVKCDISDGKPYTLCSISNDYYDGILIKFKEQKNGFDMEVYLSEVKPYLFPLSSMTEEQKKELKQYTCPNGTGYFDNYSLCCPINHFGENIPFEFMSKIIDWLNKNHFDYNGLILKGLANDATGLNIY